MKSKLIEKVQRRISNNFNDYEYDTQLLEDYFDEAVSIINKWKKFSKDTDILKYDYDNNIIKYIIESINISGLEGQSSSSANGVSKVFIATPESNLKSSIPQSL